LDKVLPKPALFHHYLLFWSTERLVTATTGLANGFRGTLHRVRLSKEQAERAVYIDFEGFKDKSPSFVDLLDHTGFTQVVLDPNLQPAARAKRSGQQQIEYWATQLVNKCLREDRLIVGFSLHDLNCLKKYSTVGDKAEPIYVNARQLANRWHWHQHNKLFEGPRTLDAFCAAANVPPRPVDCDEVPVTRYIRRILGGLAARGTYRRLTRLQKQKWGILLEYNRWDCEDLRALCRVAAK